MVAVTSPAVVNTQSSKPKKTRRGGSAARRQAKTRSNAPDTTEIEVGEGDADDDEVVIDVMNQDGSSGPLIAMTRIVGEEGDDAPMDDGDINEETAVPVFAPLSASAQSFTAKGETRRIPIPPHRFGPLKNEWVNIYSPLTEILGLQIRMNVHRKCVEIRTSTHTKEIGALQKGADFVKAFALGFDVQDSIALLRMDDLYLDSFEIKDVKTLHGDHLSRAIGRIAGQDGKTKFTIENASRTRIVLADTKIHILGSFQNIKIARDAIVSLIMGSPPGKVYANLRTIGARMRQRAL